MAFPAPAHPPSHLLDPAPKATRKPSKLQKVLRPASLFSVNGSRVRPLTLEYLSSDNNSMLIRLRGTATLAPRTQPVSTSNSCPPSSDPASLSPCLSKVVFLRNPTRRAVAGAGTGAGALLHNPGHPRGCRLSPEVLLLPSFPVDLSRQTSRASARVGSRLCGRRASKLLAHFGCLAPVPQGKKTCFPHSAPR